VSPRLVRSTSPAAASTVRLISPAGPASPGFLSNSFGGLPARIDNDCNAAALGEYRFGAGKGKKNVVYITVSTGIGGGAVIDGRLQWQRGRTRPHSPDDGRTSLRLR